MREKIRKDFADILPGGWADTQKPTQEEIDQQREIVDLALLDGAIDKVADAVDTGQKAEEVDLKTDLELVKAAVILAKFKEEAEKKIDDKNRYDELSEFASAVAARSWAKKAGLKKSAAA